LSFRELETYWNVAQSNPGFEVWLYFHAKSNLPELGDIAQCNNWKPHLPKVIKGGFNSDFHPASIEVAIENAKNLWNVNTQIALLTRIISNKKSLQIQ
jgi:hypothetical protein